MKYLIIIVLLATVGCEQVQEDHPEDWRCTAEELILVEKEFSICTQSSYFSSYCFLQAKKSICTEITDVQNSID